MVKLHEDNEKRKEFKDLITCCIINTFEDTSIVSQANWKNN
jgi:hypothetical protein